MLYSSSCRCNCVYYLLCTVSCSTINC